MGGSSSRSRKLGSDSSDEAVSPNEAIDFGHNCIFVAIPKNGTISVRSQLTIRDEYLYPHSHLDIVQIRRLLRLHHVMARLGQGAEFPDADTPSDGELAAEADTQFGAMFKFAAVRNPWARAVSLYYRGEGDAPHRHMSFEQFCENHCYASDTCFWPSRHRHQADWLEDENGVSLMDYVYKVEAFESAIEAIAEMTDGSIRLENRALNANSRSRAGDYRTLYNDHCRKLIARRFEKDIDLFGYSF